MTNAQSTPQQLNLEDLVVSSGANPVVKQKRWRAEKMASAEEDLANGLAMKIPLTKGFEAIIDVADAALVTARKWRIHSSGKRIHACHRFWRTISKGNHKKIVVSLHRFLMSIDDPKVCVDHCNGDTLDNRRSNLRLVTQRQNSWNNHGWRHKKYKGVKFNKYKWASRIRIDGKLVETHGFDSEEEAARDYDTKALLHYGVYARLNFPPK